MDDARAGVRLARGPILDELFDLSPSAGSARARKILAPLGRSASEQRPGPAPPAP